jgi:hypothetical protein
MNHCKSMNLGASRGVTPAPNLLFSIRPSLFDLLASSAFRLFRQPWGTPLADPRFSSGSAAWFSQHGIREMERNNLTRVLATSWRPVQEPKQTHSIHRPARDIDPPTAELEIAYRSAGASASGQAAAGAASLVQRNSVPSTPPWPFAWSFPRSELNKSARGVEFTSQT